MTENQKMTISSYDATAAEFNSTIAKLTNYDHCYDFFCGMLKNGDSILDLACGPAQISKYILGKVSVSVTGVDLSEGMLEVAAKEIPGGKFIRHSIIDFRSKEKFDACILGFGIPYLSGDEASSCIRNAADNLKTGGIFYISFMDTPDGSDEFVRMEKTSFGGENLFEIHYHNRGKIRRILEESGLSVIREFTADYKESDGSITTDIIMIAGKESQNVQDFNR